MLGIKPPINLAYHYARLDAVKKETSRIVISMSHTRLHARRSRQVLVLLEPVVGNGDLVGKSGGGKYLSHERVQV